jgi:uncharacterized membrane protein
MKIKTLACNALVAALYIAVSYVIQPFGFSNIQFRLSEMFNHLVVFNKRFIYGILLGVFLTNLFFSPMVPFDLVFGVGQSLLSLSITIFSARFVKSTVARMILNTLVFTFTMFLIAIELHLALEFPFFATWLTTAVGEFAVMLIGVPVMYALNKRMRLGELV